MEDQENPTVGAGDETTTPPKENEFVGIMNTLEALNTEGRRVVDIIPQDVDRSLPKTVLIPVRVEKGSRKGTVFVTETGVYLDQNGLLDQELSNIETVSKVSDITGESLPQRTYLEDVFSSWESGMILPLIFAGICLGISPAKQ